MVGKSGERCFFVVYGVSVVGITHTMPMLLEAHIKIDKKRRVAIPVKHRANLGNSVVIKRGLDDCLQVHPLSLWETGDTKFQRLSKKLLISEDHRKLARFLTAAEQVDVDASGRILIPEQFSEFAELKEDVVLLGNDEGFEIWSAEKWNKDGISNIEDLRKIAESKEFRPYVE